MTDDQNKSGETITLPFSAAAKMHTQSEITRLRQANFVHLQEIQSTGASVDLGSMMVTAYFEGMVELGLLTEDEHLALQLMWEERFAHQLKQMKAQIEKMIEQAQARQRLAALGRPHSGLIVPGT